MNAIDNYFSNISKILDDVLTSQRDSLEKAARAVADANETSHNIFAFGCNHAGLIALELFYRSGGMVTINPIRAPGMMCEVSPMTMSSDMERMAGYGGILLRATPAGGGDILLIHSVSGRNSVTVDMALAAKSLGMTVIAITNMNTTSGVSSRHSSGNKLCDLADILIDNCGCKGDASLSIPGLAEKTAPTSTAVGTVIVNSIVARAIELMIADGFEPPVFMSANLDGGDEHNKKIIEKYKDHIFYI